MIHPLIQTIMHCCAGPTAEPVTAAVTLQLCTRLLYTSTTGQVITS
jgi:hypothetical protein